MKKIKALILFTIATLLFGCCTVNNIKGSTNLVKTDQEKIYDLLDKNMSSIVLVTTTVMGTKCLDAMDTKSCYPVLKKFIGTGYVVDAAEGLIVTNNHVIEDHVYIDVSQGNNTSQVFVVASFPKQDVALIKLITPKTMKRLTEVKFAKNSRVGQKIIVVGHPLGLLNSVSFGIISAKRGSFVQTDAAINGGNSGGPIFDLDGNVVAMSTFGYSKCPSGNNSGINFGVDGSFIDALLSEYF
jgi:S1-C subfamily serine protease